MTAWLGVSPDMCEIEWGVMCMCMCAYLQDVCKWEKQCVYSAEGHKGCGLGCWLVVYACVCIWMCVWYWLMVCVRRLDANDRVIGNAPGHYTHVHTHVHRGTQAPSWYAQLKAFQLQIRLYEAFQIVFARIFKKVDRHYTNIQTFSWPVAQFIVWASPWKKACKPMIYDLVESYL